MGICDGRVVIVTGAGRGIGRGHAFEFARQGAKVVVNDLGAELDGSGGSTGPAGEVVDEIRAVGGEAVANGNDVADWDGAQAIVQSAIDAFGGLDVIVNNAGLPPRPHGRRHERRRVGRRHPRPPEGSLLRHPLRRSRTGGSSPRPATAVDARIINTSSGAGLMGSVGQGAYSAAKAGIAALTLVESAELGRYGVTANAIAPAARTRMTEAVFAETMAEARRRLRRDGARERRPARGVARQRRLRRRDRARVRGRGRHARRSPTAGSTARRSTRAAAGSPTRSAPRYATSSPRPRHPPPSTARPDPDRWCDCPLGWRNRTNVSSGRVSSGVRRSWPCPGRRRRTWSRGRSGRRGPRGR